MNTQPTVASRVFDYLRTHRGSDARQVATALGISMVSAKNSLSFLKDRRRRIHVIGERSCTGGHRCCYAVGAPPRKPKPVTPPLAIDPFAALQAMQRAAQQHQQFRRP